MLGDSFFDRGWCRFSFDPALAAWVNEAIHAAREAVGRAANERWFRCGGTWFAGVNALPNDHRGAVKNGSALSGKAVDFIRDALGLHDFDWDRAQISVCYPDYPQRMPSESEAAFRYRLVRDAAHVDGLLAEGLTRRRHLREHHGFVLGIPMVETSCDASPFVVWEGSHEMVRDKLTSCFEGLSPEKWGDVDITGAYHEVRRNVFEVCRRVEVWSKPGEAYLAHRLSVHGMAPWGKQSHAPTDGRMVCYFRPELKGPLEWLLAP